MIGEASVGACRRNRESPWQRSSGPNGDREPRSHTGWPFLFHCSPVVVGLEQVSRLGRAPGNANPPPAGNRWGAWCQRSVPVAGYTDVSVGDSVLGEVTSERSQLEQVSKHPPDVEERLGPDNSQPIDEPLLRDRLHVLTLGVARMTEA